MIKEGKTEKQKNENEKKAKVQTESEGDEAAGSTRLSYAKAQEVMSFDKPAVQQ